MGGILKFLSRSPIFVFATLAGLRLMFQLSYLWLKTANLSSRERDRVERISLIVLSKPNLKLRIWLGLHKFV